MRLVCCELYNSFIDSWFAILHFSPLNCKSTKHFCPSCALFKKIKLFLEAFCSWKEGLKAKIKKRTTFPRLPTSLAAVSRSGGSRSLRLRLQTGSRTYRKAFRNIHTPLFITPLFNSSAWPSLTKNVPPGRKHPYKRMFNGPDSPSPSRR